MRPKTALHATLVGMVRQARPHRSVQAHVRVDATRLIPRARVLLRQTALSAMLVATVQRVGSRLRAVVTRPHCEALRVQERGEVAGVDTIDL